MAQPVIKTPPAPGFIFKDVARSTKEALSKHALSAAIQVTKSALVAYIRNHFEGEFKDLFRAVMPTADQFVLTSNLSTREPMSIPVQLLRRYPDFRAKMPCIIVNHGDPEPQATSIAGGLEGGFYDAENDARVMRLTSKWRFPISIMAAAADDTQADELMEAVVFIFTTLKTITQTARITSEERGFSWVVTLPHMPGHIAFAENEMYKDPKDKFYTYIIPLDVMFESSVLVAYANRTKYTIQVGSAPSIITSLPDQLPLGTTFNAGVIHRPLEAQFQTSNPSIAVVDENGYVRTKKLGTFDFQVVQPISGGDLPKVLFSKTVRVVA